MQATGLNSVGDGSVQRVLALKSRRLTSSRLNVSAQLQLLGRGLHDIICVHAQGTTWARDVIQTASVLDERAREHRDRPQLLSLAPFQALAKVAESETFPEISMLEPGAALLLNARLTAVSLEQIASATATIADNAHRLRWRPPDNDRLLAPMFPRDYHVLGAARRIFPAAESLGLQTLPGMFAATLGRELEFVEALGWTKRMVAYEANASGDMKPGLETETNPFVYPARWSAHAKARLSTAAAQINVLFREASKSGSPDPHLLSPDQVVPLLGKTLRAEVTNFGGNPLLMMPGAEDASLG